VRPHIFRRSLNSSDFCFDGISGKWLLFIGGDLKKLSYANYNETEVEQICIINLNLQVVTLFFKSDPLVKYMWEQIYPISSQFIVKRIIKCRHKIFEPSSSLSLFNYWLEVKKTLQYRFPSLFTALRFQLYCRMKSKTSVRYQDQDYYMDLRLISLKTGRKLNITTPWWCTCDVWRRY